MISVAPRLSVLTPAYNSERTLRESVASALGQTEASLEVIVVDDGSRLRAEEVLAEITDPRLRVVRHPSNLGISAARNTGLRNARAPFVAYLDADDVWEPEYAATVLAHFDDPAVGLVYTNAWLIGHPLGKELFFADESAHPIDRFPDFAERNPIPSLTATMRTSALREAGGYARWLRVVSDYHMHVRLIMHGWRFSYVAQPLARYRWPSPRHGASWDTRVVDHDLIKMWLAFVLRHPTVPGPRYQLRMRLASELKRAAHRPRAG